MSDNLIITIGRECGRRQTYSGHRSWQKSWVLNAMTRELLTLAAK